MKTDSLESKTPVITVARNLDLESHAAFLKSV